MTIAVVGSGAAAQAVLAQIRCQQPHVAVHVYDAAEPEVGHEAPSEPDDYDTVYQRLKSQHGLKFPPPKSHFGSIVDSRPSAQIKTDWQRPGGLTKYWGATCLPYSDDQLRALGLSRALLDPYYQRTARLLGIAGDSSSPFAQKLQHNYIQAAAPRRLALFDKLDSALNSAEVRAFVAGGNCVALDTDETSGNSCTYCGHCLAGCYRGAIFCSDSASQRAARPDHITYRRGLVEKIDLEGRRVQFLRDG